jgi:uncharacterized protein YbjQ (UPF0145 family)
LTLGLVLVAQGGVEGVRSGAVARGRELEAVAAPGSRSLLSRARQRGADAVAPVRVGYDTSDEPREATRLGQVEGR